MGVHYSPVSTVQEDNIHNRGHYSPVNNVLGDKPRGDSPYYDNDILILSHMLQSL